MNDCEQHLRERLKHRLTEALNKGQLKGWLSRLLVIKTSCRAGAQTARDACIQNCRKTGSVSEKGDVHKPANALLEIVLASMRDVGLLADGPALHSAPAIAALGRLNLLGSGASATTTPAAPAPSRGALTVRLYEETLTRKGADAATGVARARQDRLADALVSACNAPTLTHHFKVSALVSCEWKRRVNTTRHVLVCWLCARDNKAAGWPRRWRKPCGIEPWHVLHRWTTIRFRRSWAMGCAFTSCRRRWSLAEAVHKASTSSL